MSDTCQIPSCPRCRSTELALSPQRSEDVSFLECPRCGRQYQLRSEDLLTERWMGPLSLLLYPIALSTQPLEDVERAVHHLVDIEEWPESRLTAAMTEAELELRSPSQRVSKILDLFSHASEEEVREYLRRMVEQLGQRLAQ
jgi:hypothetical protein